MTTQSTAFIPYLTAGDPTLSVSEKLIISLANMGADVIEVGVPFSDPLHTKVTGSYNFIQNDLQFQPGFDDVD